ncbi:MAG: hypothetical protein RIC55_36360 [Pirellulaceae bacterium]
MMRWLLLAMVVVSGVVNTLCADDVVPADPPLRWWKGNIHTHSLWSDGNEFPEMIAEWYRTHDYNFLALSDHNILSDGQRWMKHDDIVRRNGKDALAKYRARFGGGWVETRGDEGAPGFEVRLKPLDEFRPLVEERGRFLMIQGEEISDRAEGKPVHMNATNVKEVIQPLGGKTVRETIDNNLRAVEDQARRSGREILAHLNHPNFGLAVTAEDLAAVVRERFFEVYNGHPGVKHEGDEHHPSVERLWDIANTIRLGEVKAAPLFGVATDDSHNYHGKPGSHPGRGWIMVRARYLTPEHLIRAIKAGDFYASSGVTLREVAFDREKNLLRLEIAPDKGVVYSTQFIGTPRDYDATSKPRLDKDGKPIASSRQYSSDVGQVLATVSGLTPEYQLTGDELYVRAVVTSSRHHPDPSFDHQHEQAWTQPVSAAEEDSPAAPK